MNRENKVTKAPTVTTTIHSVLIVDDEPAARQKLKLFLNDHKDFNVVAEASNGVEALQCIENYQPSLVFLDIQMPLLDGISVASNLELDCKSNIVFITGFDQYAIKAFELNAIDYLMKPYDKARLAKTLNRYREHMQTVSDYNLPKFVQDYREQNNFPEKLLFKADNGIQVVNVQDIQWVESSGNYVKICTKSTAFIARQTLLTVLSQLNPKHFIRIHRSHIINIAEVAKIEPQGKGDYSVYLLDSTVLKLSRKYKDDFFDLFN
ncbi:LytR/AlgR family response regulator transcription factor [Colwelliaceae bacterium BS250]